VHGCVPEIMSLSTVIPIPKGKHANLTESVSYRGIAWSSIFGKIFDLVLLFRYSEGLMSCDLQFGFKAHRSTDMCTMILKESVAYYVNNGSSVYCWFLDATKAFDRVEYCKLFRMLMKRQLPSVVLRLLCNMYLNHMTLVEYNGFKSAAFKVLNGVKQGGIISPIMFGVYIDDLLLSLKSSAVSCYMGNFLLVH